ncbi:MAG: DUF547 domain-containing protein [Desulfuromusa sp.]|nr:DUF547 domain-containing protein [Desulfuromusa sp.]
MKKYIFLVTLLVCGFFSINAVAGAPATAVPEPFRGHDANSKLAIDYRDLDSLLDTVVLFTGRSNRKKASSTQNTTGTRMKVSVNRATINEGNRFYFEVFDDSPENQQTISKIRSRLESIPTAVSLEKFSRDEQLAYWINLYNITLIEEIVKIYPEPKLEDLLVGKDSVLSKKTLNVAGVPLSLDDIQFTILKQNYDNSPLVIYGLYQGIIGGPSIRKSAYTGKYVYADLIENAIEFINSNRGTESRNKRVFRVSSLYERNQLFFPDFDTDLTEHLLTYLEGDERAELQAATKIKTDIDDWTVTDLYGSTRDLGASLANNNAALAGAVSGGSSSRLTSNSVVATRYSPAVLQRLNEINAKKAAERTGTVTIEEMGEAQDEASATDQDDHGVN